MRLLAVDPGVTTGLALYCTERRKLLRVWSSGCVDALFEAADMHAQGELQRLVIEDARLRTGYFGERSRHKLQGAGSVKRDCGIWTELAARLGVPLQSISPRDKGRKLDSAEFKRLTGWDERTNEHARDAAMLVFGR